MFDNKLLYILICLLNVQLLAQRTFLTDKDSIFVEIQRDNFFLLHPMNTGQTLYGLKTFYNLEIPQINLNNQELDFNALSIGQLIRIPVHPDAFKSIEFKAGYQPVYYEVKPKDNLFRICNQLFKLNIHQFKKINQLVDESLFVGQKLIVGFINKKGIPDDYKLSNGLSGNIATENEKNKKAYQQSFFLKNKENLIQGLAVWDNNMQLSAKNKLYVLCSKFPSSTMIRIENPLTKKYLYAEVVEKMPSNSMTKDALLFLSPIVAKALGALDDQLNLRIYYVP